MQYCTAVTVIVMVALGLHVQIQPIQHSVIELFLFWGRHAKTQTAFHNQVGCW